MSEFEHEAKAKIAELERQVDLERAENDKLRDELLTKDREYRDLRAELDRVAKDRTYVPPVGEG